MSTTTTTTATCVASGCANDLLATAKRNDHPTTKHGQFPWDASIYVFKIIIHTNAVDTMSRRGRTDRRNDYSEHAKR